MHIDWETWSPRDVATLCFVIRGHELLLMRKLTGLGAGKIIAPGGRVEPGEEVIDAAVRETFEEVGIRPTAPRHRGELRFQFVDGYSVLVHVFTSDAHEGEAVTTREGIPMWTPLASIPYGEMWVDDALWLPLVLCGRAPVSGRFLFDGERMVAHELEAHDPAHALFERLASLRIATETDAHAPVFTVEQARAARLRHDGTHVKNLFLRNKKGRMWLVTMAEDRAVDLKALAARLDAGNRSFASAERLRAHLGVEPGSVTPFAAMNDPGRLVTVVLDAALPAAERVFCHPLTNDRTTAIAGADLVRFLEATGHPAELIVLP